MVIAAALVTFGTPPAAAQQDDATVDIRCDPANVLGVESCAKCHDPEIATWKATPHAQTFEALHRSPEAKAIAEKLGFRSVKRNDTCVKCHYTRREADNGRVRVISGVSCESCHGGAKDWLTLHHDYGGPNATKESESEEHRRQRIVDSVAAGMNNPANLYLIARQCLACHTTPEEELVNRGGHPAGSDDFELVAWSQGRVRHNFLRSGADVNQPSSPERLRKMYVVGLLADLEASFRATAKATEKATFGVASARRAARLKKRLHALQQLLDNPDIDAAHEAALSVPLKLNQGRSLNAAADLIGRAASNFAETADGADLAAIDAVLPKPTEYK
ncbi:MAG: cytochrome c family protein [Planctomycetota bacterium]